MVLSQYELLPAGKPAPLFRLRAVKTGRELCSRDCVGSVLGLIFHSRETLQAVIDINTVVRPRYPEATQLTLASVVDLSVVPRILRRTVTPILERAYNEAARQTARYIPSGYTAADYIFLLPDWDGAVSRAYGVRDADVAAAIVVINQEGQIVGSYQGPDPGATTLWLIEKAASGG